MNHIPVYREINEFLEAAGFRQRTRDPNFMAVRLEETYPEVKQMMPPFRKEFFLVAMAHNTGQSRFRLDEHTFSSPKRYLVFQSPGHVLSWQRGEGLTGYLVYFKAESLAFFRNKIADEFKYFDLLHTNFFHISLEEFHHLEPDFEELLREFAQHYSFSEQVLYAKLLALLFKCKAFYAGFNASLINQNQARIITQRYLQLISNYYLEKRSVEEYSSLLHITPGHLNELVKQATGRTASSHLTGKLILEAKNLIRYTEMDITEIAYQLNFSSPAHFNRFFKKHSGKTPLVFRQED